MRKKREDDLRLPAARLPRMRIEPKQCREVPSAHGQASEYGRRILQLPGMWSPNILRTIMLRTQTPGAIGSSFAFVEIRVASIC